MFIFRISVRTMARNKSQGNGGNGGGNGRGQKKRKAGNNELAGVSTVPL